MLLSGLQRYFLSTDTCTPIKASVLAQLWEQRFPASTLCVVFCCPEKQTHNMSAFPLAAVLVADPSEWKWIHVSCGYPSAVMIRVRHYIALSCFVSPPEKDGPVMWPWCQAYLLPKALTCPVGWGGVCQQAVCLETVGPGFSCLDQSCSSSKNVCWNGPAWFYEMVWLALKLVSLL